jgi:glutamate--cysteine ligase
VAPDVYTPGTVLREIDEAEGYIASICFKTGPPTLIGVELEWNIHYTDDPTRPLETTLLSDILGPYAPTTLNPDSPHHPLPRGSAVTVEPGGQVEISSQPYASLADLHTAVTADTGQLTSLLHSAGLRFGETGIDTHRSPRQVLRTPRYDAMARTFDRHGPHGRTMMSSTAGLQLCLDAGTADRLAARWSALHALGPVMLAAFANSSHHAGHDTGWASARMRSWLGIDPARTRPALDHGDPALNWARYALDAPLLCVRRPGCDWQAPAGVTFANWVAGHSALAEAPTTDDLDYHLGTLFPPVRPRGYVEVRYLDAQPPEQWLPPVAVLVALLADESTVDIANDLCAPAAGRWTEAAMCGLADPVLAEVAEAVLDLGCRALDRTDLPAAARDEVADTVSRRMAAGKERVR